MVESRPRAGLVSRQGNNCTIRDVISGKETVSHVSQIARVRSPVGPEESEEVPALTQNDEQVCGVVSRKGRIVSSG